MPGLPPSCPHIGTQGTSGTLLSNQSIFTASEGLPAGAAVGTPGPSNVATPVSPDPGFFICMGQKELYFYTRLCEGDGKGCLWEGL